MLLERIPVVAHTDILVAGAGSAGCCAALAGTENTSGLTLHLSAIAAESRARGRGQFCESRDLYLLQETLALLGLLTSM